MIARSRLVGNFLSHCAVHRQLTRVIGLSQSVRLQSTNDSPDKNFTLKLPPNATGVSVEHSNEKSLDGTSLRVTLNISVLQSDTRVSKLEQSRKQLENLTRSLAQNNKNPTKNTNQTIISAPATYDLFQSYNSKSMREKNDHRELKVTKNPAGDRTILIDGLSAEISENAIQDYFSRFGEVELCRIPFGDQSAYVTFKSRNAVNHVLNCGPHYLVGDGIGDANDLASEEKDTETKDQSQLLEVSRDEKNNKMIIVQGISTETSLDALRAYFSQFGNVHLCYTRHVFPRDCVTGYVTFKSAKTVNHVLNCGPHYLVGDTNDLASEENKDRKDLAEFLAPSKDELTVTLGTLPPITNSDSLKKLFSKYGQVTHINAECKYENGVEKESIYVTFATKEQVVNVLKHQPLFLDGQMLIVKPITDISFSIEDDDYDDIDNDDDEVDSEDDDDDTSDDEDDSDDDDYSDFDDDDEEEDIDDDGSERSFCDNTILVKNLPKSATEEKLQKIFSEFGELTDWGVKADGSYGWVSFARPVNVRTLEDKSPTMFGKKLEVESVKNTQEAEGKNESRMDPKEFEEFQRTFEEDYDHRSKW